MINSRRPHSNWNITRENKMTMAFAVRRGYINLGRNLIKQCSSQRNTHNTAVNKYQHYHHAKRMINRRVGLVGLPFHRGQPWRGVRDSPYRMREAGVVQQLQDMDLDVCDYGDLQFDILPDSQDPPMFHIKHPKTNGMMARKVSQKIQQIVENGEVAIGIGGDHSIGIGTIHGHLQAKPDSVIFWVDAQADLNPPLASPSGNIHGMALAFLMYEMQQYTIRLKGFDWCKPCFTANDIVYIGLRDVDPAERYLLDHFNIKHYTPDDIDLHGLDYILEHCMDVMNPGLQRPIHLSFDVDGLDPSAIPCTGTPVEGGLTLDEGKFICEELGLTGKLSAIDLVEINADIGGDETKADRTLQNSISILTSCFVKHRRDKKDIPTFPAKIDKDKT